MGAVPSAPDGPRTVLGPLRREKPARQKITQDVGVQAITMILSEASESGLPSMSSSADDDLGNRGGENGLPLRSPRDSDVGERGNVGELSTKSPEDIAQEHTNAGEQGENGLPPKSPTDMNTVKPGEDNSRIGNLQSVHEPLGGSGALQNPSDKEKAGNLMHNIRIQPEGKYCAEIFDDSIQCMRSIGLFDRRDEATIITWLVRYIKHKESLENKIPSTISDLSVFVERLRSIPNNFQMLCYEYHYTKSEKGIVGRLTVEMRYLVYALDFEQAWFQSRSETDNLLLPLQGRFEFEYWTDAFTELELSKNRICETFLNIREPGNRRHILNDFKKVTRSIWAARTQFSKRLVEVGSSFSIPVPRIDVNLKKYLRIHQHSQKNPDVIDLTELDEHNGFSGASELLSSRLSSNRHTNLHPTLPHKNLGSSIVVASSPCSSSPSSPLSVSPARSMWSGVTEVAQNKNPTLSQGENANSTQPPLLVHSMKTRKRNDMESPHQIVNHKRVAPQDYPHGVTARNSNSFSSSNSLQSFSVNPKAYESPRYVRLPPRGLSHHNKEFGQIQQAEQQYRQHVREQHQHQQCDTYKQHTNRQGDEDALCLEYQNRANEVHQNKQYQAYEHHLNRQDNIRTQRLQYQQHQAYEQRMNHQNDVQAQRFQDQHHTHEKRHYQQHQAYRENTISEHDVGVQQLQHQRYLHQQQVQQPNRYEYQQHRHRQHRPHLEHEQLQDLRRTEPNDLNVQAQLHSRHGIPHSQVQNTLNRQASQTQRVLSPSHEYKKASVAQGLPEQGRGNAAHSRYKSGFLSLLPSHINISPEENAALARRSQFECQHEPWFKNLVRLFNTKVRSEVENAEYEVLRQQFQIYHFQRAERFVSRREACRLNRNMKFLKEKWKVAYDRSHYQLIQQEYSNVQPDSTRSHRISKSTEVYHQASSPETDAALTIQRQASVTETNTRRNVEDEQRDSQIYSNDLRELTCTSLSSRGEHPPVINTHSASSVSESPKRYDAPFVSNSTLSSAMETRISTKVKPSQDVRHRIYQPLNRAHSDSEGTKLHHPSFQQYEQATPGPSIEHTADRNIESVVHQTSSQYQAPLPSEISINSNKVSHWEMRPYTDANLTTVSLQFAEAERSPDRSTENLGHISDAEKSCSKEKSLASCVNPQIDPLEAPKGENEVANTENPEETSVVEHSYYQETYSPLNIDVNSDTLQVIERENGTVNTENIRATYSTEHLSSKEKPSSSDLDQAADSLHSIQAGQSSANTGHLNGVSDNPTNSHVQEGCAESQEADDICRSLAESRRREVTCPLLPGRPSVDRPITANTQIEETEASRKINLLNSETEIQNDETTTYSKEETPAQPKTKEGAISLFNKGFKSTDSGIASKTNPSSDTAEERSLMRCQKDSLIYSSHRTSSHKTSSEYLIGQRSKGHLIVKDPSNKSIKSISHRNPIKMELNSASGLSSETTLPCKEEKLEATEIAVEQQLKRNHSVDCNNLKAQPGWETEKHKPVIESDPQVGSQVKVERRGDMDSATQQSISKQGVSIDMNRVDKDMKKAECSSSASPSGAAGLVTLKDPTAIKTSSNEDICQKTFTGGSCDRSDQEVSNLNAPLTQNSPPKTCIKKELVHVSSEQQDTHEVIDLCDDDEEDGGHHIDGVGQATSQGERNGTAHEATLSNRAQDCSHLLSTPKVVAKLKGADNNSRQSKKPFTVGASPPFSSGSQLHIKNHEQCLSRSVATERLIPSSAGNCTLNKTDHLQLSNLKSKPSADTPNEVVPPKGTCPTLRKCLPNLQKSAQSNFSEHKLDTAQVDQASRGIGLSTRNGFLSQRHHRSPRSNSSSGLARPHDHKTLNMDENYARMSDDSISKRPRLTISHDSESLKRKRLSSKDLSPHNHSSCSPSIEDKEPRSNVTPSPHKPTEDFQDGKDVHEEDDFYSDRFDDDAQSNSSYEPSKDELALPANLSEKHTIPGLTKDHVSGLSSYEEWTLSSSIPKIYF